MKKLLNSFKTKTFRVGGYSVVAAAIVIAIIIIANVVVNALPSRIKMIDLSQNLLYSFSDQTKKIAENADRDVDIYLICQSGYENSTLVNLLDRYEELSDRIHVTQIDTNNNPTFAANYELSEVNNNSVLISSDLRHRYIDYEDIFVTSAIRDDDGNYMGSSVTLDGEQEITSGIYYCLMQDLPKIYQLSGHGESQLPESYVDAVNKLNLTIVDLNLLTVSAIPEDCDTLMIISPLADINENEYRMLKEFLIMGGRMMVVTSPIRNETPWFDQLMHDFAMQECEGIVVEGDSSYYAASYDPTYLLPEIQEHAITKPIQDANYIIFTPIASGIKRYGTESGFTLTQLLKTSSASFSKIKGSAMETFEREAGDINGPFSVATLMTHPSADYTYDDTMIAWFSSTAIIDEQVNTLVNGANEDLFLNTLAYICDQTNSISIHSKSLNYRYLSISGSTATTWSIILIGVLPVLTLGIGIVIFLRRRKR